MMALAIVFTVLGIIITFGVFLSDVGQDISIALAVGSIGFIFATSGVWGIVEEHYNYYDYHINLDHNNVIIDTKHGKHIVIPADSSLQLWIEQDNL